MPKLNGIETENLGNVPFITFTPLASPSPPPRAAARSIYGGKEGGLSIFGAGTRGRLENCNVWGNEKFGVKIALEADPLLQACRCFYAPRGQCAIDHLSSLSLF